MKNRRDFLKMLGLGTAALGTVVLATRGGSSEGSPPTPPRTLEAVESTTRYPLYHSDMDTPSDVLDQPDGLVVSDTDPRFKALVEATKKHYGPRMVDHVFHEMPLLKYLRSKEPVKIPEGSNRIREPFMYKGEEYESELACWETKWAEERSVKAQSDWTTPEFKHWSSGAKNE